MSYAAALVVLDAAGGGGASCLGANAAEAGLLGGFDDAESIREQIGADRADDATGRRWTDANRAESRARCIRTLLIAEVDIVMLWTISTGIAEKQ